NYRKVFKGFDPRKIIKFTKADVERLLQDAGIIRNRMKIEATINNAKCFLEVQKEFGTFSKYIWGFVGGKPIKNKWKNLKELPAKTLIAEAISKDMKKRGFKFLGPTIVYAHMQATGMVNDHTCDCFRYNEV
ncbi:MAG: DNA-3-methyladenine glycosylase I, partial [Candidatus Omnitrophica bacterium]|nr:DNA-3-methyladenine glycosylase I [Candidatus Omnitrophota bacterium]